MSCGFLWAALVAAASGSSARIPADLATPRLGVAAYAGVDQALRLQLRSDALRPPALLRGVPGWSAANTLLEVGYGLVSLLDWGQTRNVIAPGKSGRHELNPVLGSHPSPAAVDLYFLGAALGHAALSVVLPHPWRESWQTLSLGVEGGVVGRNLVLGTGFGF